MGHESIHDEDLPYLQAVMRHEPHADEAFCDRFCSFLERLSAQKVDHLYNRLPQDERQDIVGDAVNHALNHLLSHPERFDPSRGTVRGLLTRVAFNRVKDLVRAATRRSRYDVPPPPYEEGNDEIRPPSHRSHERPAEDRVLDNETENDDAEALHKAILELSPLQRQAINLQLLRSFSTKEIARALDMSENAAESLIRRARARLRSLLAERAQ